MLKQILWPITEQSQVAEARRMAVDMAKNLGFDETVTGKVALVITEAARNLAKHARGGELIIRHLEVDSTKGIEIMALDKGPGMANVSQCMTDGYSTSGSPGTGLGSISRLSSLFDIYSEPGAGTALVAQIWAKPLPVGQQTSGLETGAICQPKPGENVSGDGWAQVCQPGKCLFLVADGLGHGPLAAEASLAAERVFIVNAHLDPGKILEAIHAALWRTRGAAVAVSRLDLARRVVIFTGVGNISGQIITAGGTTHMASYNGTAGGEISKIRELTYPWPEGAVLVMHSDGLTTHWKLSQHPGLIRKHTSLIAGILYRDYSRGTDDVTVLVARESGR